MWCVSKRVRHHIFPNHKNIGRSRTRFLCTPVVSAPARSIVIGSLVPAAQGRKIAIPTKHVLAVAANSRTFGTVSSRDAAGEWKELMFYEAAVAAASSVRTRSAAAAISASFRA